jgi:FkbM family methyltransferase
VICFEPSATAFAELTRRLGDRVTAFEYGLSDHEGSITLYAPEAGSALASPHQRRHPVARWDPLESVRMKRLDSVVPELELTRIDLLKLDVEGHELAALRGADQTLRSGVIETIQFEFGGCAIDSRVFLRDFFELLSERFAISRVVQDGLFPIEYSELHEVFTTTNYVATARHPRSSEPA